MFNGLGLFEGISGITLGLEKAGLVDPVCFVEREKYAQEVLKLRYPEVPIWDDVTTFDGKPWKGYIDFISGGFPCQNISVAGKGIGITGSRSGLWSEYERIISEVEPFFALIENVPALFSWFDVEGRTALPEIDIRSDRGRIGDQISMDVVQEQGIATCIRDLAKIGYHAERCIISAKDMGAPHLRNRVFILAYPEQQGTRSEGQKIGYEKRRASNGGTKSIRQRNGEISSSRSISAVENSELIRRGRRRNEDAQGQDEALQTERSCAGDKPGFLADSESERKRRLSARSRREGKGKADSERSGEDVPDADKFNDDRTGSDSSSIRGERSEEAEVQGCDVPNTTEPGLERSESTGEIQRGSKGLFAERCTEWWSIEPDVGRVANGVPSRVDRLKCLGNAVVPQCAEYIGRLIMERICHRGTEVTEEDGGLFGDE